ncbi:MAG: hypothetical protein U0R71_15900 [Solirubrobacterales bacterium]
MFSRGSDPLARQVVLAVAAGRIAVGSGALLATRPALRGLGFAETDASGLALAKLAGGRDLALGAVTLALRDRPAALRTAALAAAALDVADAVTFALAGAGPATRQAGIRGVVSGGAAAALGLWAWRRL